MSERGTKLMTRAGRQLDEMAEFIGTLGEADLRKPCADPGAADSPGDTVGAFAAHMAEGYRLLGRLLRATGYVSGSAEGDGHGPVPDHERGPSALAVSDVLDRLAGGKAPIGQLATLTDEQLDSVPAPAGRFADGRRTLEQVIDAVIAHQAAHLVTLKRAVA